MMKRTFQPKKRQEQKEHGFMKRMKTSNLLRIFCGYLWDSPVSPCTRNYFIRGDTGEMLTFNFGDLLECFFQAFKAFFYRFERATDVHAEKAFSLGSEIRTAI